MKSIRPYFFLPLAHRIEMGKINEKRKDNFPPLYKFFFGSDEKKMWQKKTRGERCTREMYTVQAETGRPIQRPRQPYIGLWAGDI